LHPGASYGRNGVARGVDMIDSELLIVTATIISAKPYLNDVFFLFENLLLI
jgi:hypothetical protein